jgi:amidophosphoribosyltransferase
VIQTVFNVPFEKVQEIEPGNALIIKKNGTISMKEILPPQLKKHVLSNAYISLEDAEIYQERKRENLFCLPF